MANVVFDLTLTDVDGNISIQYTSIPESMVRRTLSENLVVGNTFQIVVKDPTDPSTPNGPNVIAEQQPQQQVVEQQQQQQRIPADQTTFSPDKVGPGPPPQQ